MMRPKFGEEPKEVKFMSMDVAIATRRGVKLNR